MEDPSAVEPLVKTFEQDEDMREVVVWALGEIGRRDPQAMNAREKAIDRLERKSGNNDEVWTGDLTRQDFPISDDASELLDQLRSSDTRTRRHAVLNLAFLGTRHKYESTREVEQVVDMLLDTLRDPVREVRAAVVWALDEINPSKSARIQSNRNTVR